MEEFMGNANDFNTDDKWAGIPAEVLGLLESSKGDSREALCSMAEDLFFFAELIDLQRCIIRMMRIMGDKLPKELSDMASGIPDMEIPVLEKWALFTELM